MQHWQLSGKKVLITGGTKGIGLAAAQEMQMLGAEICVVARNADDIQAMQETWAASGKQLLAVAADVATGAGRQAVLEYVSAHWERLDVLVNNVGSNIRKKLNEYSEAEYRGLFELNLFSEIEMCRLFFPLLQRGQDAGIINVASVAGVIDVHTGAPYAMTKSASIQLTRNLAVEWAPYGIRVNAVSPWFTRTPLTASWLSDPERLQRIVARTPMGRVAEASEMARIIAFLAMPASSYITGHNIIADGGMTASTW